MTEAPDDRSQGTHDVLFLCTGNICRSPVAEALLRQRLDAAGIPARVHSAGLALDGRPITRESGDLLARAGIDPSAHRSRVMDAEMIGEANIVVGMTREHVREAVMLCHGAWPRAFTLKELVRRGEQAGRRSPGQPLDEWLEKVGAGRKTSDLLGWDDADDVPDPYGLDRVDYEHMGRDVKDLVDRMAALVWGI